MTNINTQNVVQLLGAAEEYTVCTDSVLRKILLVKVVEHSGNKCKTWTMTHVHKQMIWVVRGGGGGGNDDTGEKM
jgi:hypothetical protein